MKYLTLLFLSFLCTCVSAQKVSPVPFSGSGSMIVEFGHGTWDVSISSAVLHEKHKFISEDRYRESPREFAGYTVIKATDRYDLRMVHKLIDERLAAGWKLVATNQAMAVGVIDYTEVFQPEVIHYTFSISSPPVPEVSVAEAITVMNAQVLSTSKNNKLRGKLMRQADSTYTLLIEELIGTVWFEYYRLHDKGMMAGDVPTLIESIELDEKRINFTVLFQTGRYQYDFLRWTDTRYILNGFRFQSKNECGLQELTADLTSGVLVNYAGKYLAEPCGEGEKGLAFKNSSRIRQAWLSSFIPGTRRIELKKPEATVFY